MKYDKYRRDFLQKMGLVTLGVSSSTVLLAKHDIGNPFEWSPVQDEPNLKSLPPSALFSVMDLNLPELKEVRQTLENDGYDEALTVLLDYYRKKYPKPTQIPHDKSVEHQKTVI